MSEQNENKITAIFLSEKENKIKWHHSRWFWGIVVGTLLIWSLFFYFFTLNIRGDNFLISPLLNKLMNTFFKNSDTTNIITILLYSIIALLLLYFSFKQPKIKILYIIIFITNLVLSNILAVYILSGLY